MFNVFTKSFYRLKQKVLIIWKNKLFLKDYTDLLYALEKKADLYRTLDTKHIEFVHQAL